MPLLRPTPDPEQLRALAMVAESPEGMSAALLLTIGFKERLISALADAGLVTLHSDFVKARPRPVEVVRVKITDAGRSALER
jgi:hypothetical protein